MEKAQRLMALIMTINRKHKFKVKDLANEFDVSQRTILRDMQELGEIGVPLYSEVGPHGGYQVLNNTILPLIEFTEQEVLSIFFAYQSLQMYESLPFEVQYASALKKFYYISPENIKDRIDKMKDRILFWIPQIPLSVPYLNRLLDTAIEQKAVTIKYDSASGVSERDILPVGIYTTQGLWYCPAYCFKSQEYRLFRVDRIISCVIKEEPIEMPTQKLTLQTWLSLNQDEGTQLELSVKFSRKGIRRFESQYWKPDEVRILEDGTGILETTIYEKDVPFFAHIFLGYGTNAEVLSPEILREEIKRELENVKILYSAERS
ncbi:MAG: DNA-binding protein [Pelosinus sp.]|jgi:predicted DNA-binding transcriptional regulator YafY|nr:DNA-binding protein [Pelosinus sp.]